MGERIRRGQLDGVASPGTLCERLAPSLRVLEVLGLFQGRGEWSYVAERLRPVFDEELARSGFVNLGESWLGEDIILSRTPISNVGELLKARIWVWDIDEVKRQEMDAMSLRAEALPIEEAARGYDRNLFDAYFAITGVAMVFQWSVQARYYTPIAIDHLAACLLVSQASFDLLSYESQKSVKAAGAKFMRVLEDVSQQQHDSLVGGLFEKRGIRPVRVTAQFQRDFVQMAERARTGLGDRLIPPFLLQRATVKAV